MNVKTMIAVTTLLMSSGPVLATGNTMELKANHPNAVGGAAPGAPAKSGGGMPMKTMHEHMQKMRSQMAEINRTEDPDKRDELIQSHMANMQEMMKRMQGMPGGKMMSHQQGDKKAAPKDDMMEVMNRQEMLEHRMDIIEMMMEQMLQNQAASKKTSKYRKWRYNRYKEN